MLLSIIHYPPVSVRSNCRKCIAHVIDLPAARSLVLLLLALNPLTEAVPSQSHVRTINQHQFTRFLESRVISSSVRKLRCTLKTPSCESGHATLAGTSRTGNRGIQAKCFPQDISIVLGEPTTPKSRPLLPTALCKNFLMTLFCPQSIHILGTKVMLDVPSRSLSSTCGPHQATKEESTYDTYIPIQ